MKPELKPNYLDPDNLEVIVVCHSCRAHLWTLKVLSRFGDKVGATEYKPLGDAPEFSDKLELCHKCDRPFYIVDGKGVHKYAVKHPKTGTLFMV